MIESFGQFFRCAVECGVGGRDYRSSHVECVVSGRDYRSSHVECGVGGSNSRTQ